MSNRNTSWLLAGAAIAALATTTPALSQDGISYPRMTGSGENSEIDYGPGPHGNVVGGGAAIATGSGENTEIRHLDPSFAQVPDRRVMAVTVGSGENSSIVFVPADTDRIRLALIGHDGSLPAETMAGRGLLAWLFGQPRRG
ncbi:hypothetical protein [Teichococcus vastitatis]|uniref:hypothetical protein n=1 Tax=Teichococcus vastitatis TaxID=2307076 RepID=UPI000E76F44C|nr:hypothetical protein [Pseudoroseomonas vastitatis]